LDWLFSRFFKRIIQPFNDKRHARLGKGGSAG
jgi:hypothetical protein